MTAQILDGKATAKTIKSELAERVSALVEAGHPQPGLATVLVGDDPGSAAYVRGKHRDSEQIGLNSIQKHLPADTTQEQLEAVIDELNADPACTGYIVQLPLPKHLDTDAILERVDPAKDADGLHPMNLGRLVLNANRPIHTPLPCTPRAVIELLERHGIDLRGKDVVVVGRGVTVGRSIGALMTRRAINATVTLTHTGTTDLADHLRRADVIVAAAGVAVAGTAALLYGTGKFLEAVGHSFVAGPEAMYKAYRSPRGRRVRRMFGGSASSESLDEARYGHAERLGRRYSR